MTDREQLSVGGLLGPFFLNTCVHLKLWKAPAGPGTGSVCLPVCPLSDPCSYLVHPLTIDKNWDIAAPGLAL